MLFALEKEAQIASGITNEDRIELYLGKLEDLCRRFADNLKSVQSPLLKARKVFDYLWQQKPRRYQRHGNYKIHKVLDAQLSEDREAAVGNCLGLTLLFNILLKKIGIQAASLYLEDAFAQGPHVLTLLPIEKTMIEIENIIPEGFNYKGHRDNPTRSRWCLDQHLVADIYLSRGNELFDEGRFAQALTQYEMAIQLNPQYEKAHINKVIALQTLK